MSTEAQLAANRQNAQASTGPVTDAGKNTSSQNARKLGVSSNSGFALLPGEDPDDYNQLFTAITQEMLPATAHEGYLVGLMAQARWKRARIQYHEIELLDQFIAGEPVEAKIALMMRYAADAERAYYKAHREFERSRLQRDKADQVEANQAMEKYLMAPPGQAQGFAIKIRQPPATVPPPPAPVESASFRKTAINAAATLGNLALRL